MDKERKPSQPPRATDLPRPQFRQPQHRRLMQKKKTLEEKIQQRWEGERCKNLDLPMKHSNIIVATYILCLLKQLKHVTEIPSFELLKHPVLNY
jgi:hypothetical protein